MGEFDHVAGSGLDLATLEPAREASGMGDEMA